MPPSSTGLALPVAGGIAMGLTAVPYAVSLWRERP
jgi:hypothetical protein